MYTDNKVQFRHNDDHVVVIIGSGAGGGTLANELAQKGVDVVVLKQARCTRKAISRRKSGARSSSFHGSTIARHRATGASRKISPTCPRGSARPWAARRSTGRARACAFSRTSSRPRRLTATCRAPICSTGR
ncbi:FAD-dependent monooxygenase [Caballeronia sp. AZ1_KS37]|uniref:FAD-dependent monooxygenase n=1 Tax=Caballeronia sp. AZ1_KS37 TaxID=2921756 RepID=UPI0032EF2837